MDRDAGAAAAYMSGILEVKYEKGELSEEQKEQINDFLEEGNMSHIKIE